MADENQAGRLILSQISMFNEAVVLFKKTVQPAVLGAIDECVGAFAEREQWVGEFQLVGDDDADCWLAPGNWNLSEKGTDPDCTAWFAIDKFDESDDCWTASFCNQGIAVGGVGFMFGAYEGRFGKKMAWNKAFLLVDSAAMAELKRLDFQVVENSDGKKTFFLPILLESERLAETWGNEGGFAESDECFEPVKAALEKLKMAWPIFDGLLKAWPVKA